ncbi:ferrichrome ABC transporter permease [Alkalihalobacillus alcalophilus ATCC 27647 = CGMCC 1.3604]|uniref:Cobalamin/Fe3+-siderophores transporter n=1 Tax=Alkalihalobacillus alcalophilus ATCC 27647 = CGMCC 1.3604 TaxID=1218173 RepID=J8TTM3_ALKAL|nr:iron ABC transporter permease [Alkalihalobacillus alcalophilus]AFV25742.1 cobalamin/Fe3+-siderophores transporter [Alkalihalobacillus alcalophilus ATCC 27647 = CGMCC 1.3604]KGA96344.1 iron ABC transporter [Alkalihalobacillus alcalophilus ATCC 27647 = CGMCC 1.3604]MED1563839.1 iron ABC transporter permease [Alkalihalobacillus alcalophilus]THG90166.1 ferrichrome ABC transporter permease [Alkalihalobacillus alcalophilus ATCC 27647 = CGMCC 1.3604]
MEKGSKRILTFSVKLILAIVVTGFAFIMALTYGAAETSVQDVWSALFRTSTSNVVVMLQEIRLPRIVAAVVVGAALAVAGAIMQGMTRNPLADPGLIGLTAGANAALALTIALLPAVNYFGLMIACFIGAAIGASLVFGIGSSQKGGLSSFRIILAGAAISTFLHAIAEGIGLYFKISKDVSMWTAGGLIGTTWGQLNLVIPIIMSGLIIAILFSKQLTILSLSEEVATGLGQKTFVVKMVLFIVTVILAGAAVSLVGNLVFIGLMIPHIVRVIVGMDYRAIIPMSAVIGALFMLLADTAARTIHAPFETPVAAVVALLGLPFFLLIVRKGGKAL